tara:strand:+ start:25 stop:519 length:495 start_codon:yes stop_codon:yes gene_type:complete
MLEFKYETQNDEDGVENLLDLVFSPNRFNLSSYSLRNEVPKIKTLCFVAKNTDGNVVGVIRHWPILIGNRKNLALLIGPIAIHPVYQGEGIGSYLINYSITKSKKYGWKRALLIGDIDYYKNFGFYQQKDKKIIFPSPTDSKRILLIDLEKNSFKGLEGKVQKF